MKVSFHIGTHNFGDLNTMIFWEIKDESQLENIKLITRNSALLANTHIESRKEISATHNLTIYLPDWDQNYNPSGNFEYLFEHVNYLEWKKVIITKFPDLADQFPVAEKKVKNQQELYQTEHLLMHYRNERYGFYRNAEYIGKLQKRVAELQDVCNPESNPGFTRDPHNLSREC